jgi:endoglucanase
LKPLNRTLAFVLIGVMLLILQSAAYAQDVPGVSPERFARVQRGVNLTGWFWGYQWRGAERMQEIKSYYDRRDFALLQQLGLTHVRVPIDLGFLYDANSPDLMNAEALAVLDKAISEIQSYNLAVIVDLHSTSIEDAEAANNSGRLEDPAFVEAFIQFWQNFAAHLNSTTNPEITFIEPMNEPVFFNDPSLWPPIQSKLIRAIREVAPQHTLIATGALWSGIETLTALEPLPDSNILYNFHFYEPFYFTHQGASWVGDVGIEAMRGVPYPSSPEAIDMMALSLSAETQGRLAEYGAEYWDASLLREQIGAAADWAREKGVYLICDEFGTYNRFAPPADRGQWLYDARTTLENLGIGWTMWEYLGDFGLAQEIDGQRFADNLVIYRLGLNPAQYVQ